MKKVTFEVEVKYTAKVEAEVPDDVAKSLEYMEEEYGLGFNDSQIDPECDDGMDWLAANVSEADGLNWEYTVTNLEIGGQDNG